MIFKHYQSIQEIPEKCWQEIEDPDYPFADYDFLESLELSGSVGGETGWTPHYIGLWQDERLQGACFAFEKAHSYGEYIFDWAWAEAAQSAGIPYYPKLLSAAPFTPATGRKFLVHSMADDKKVMSCLSEEFTNSMSRLGSHSAHLLFILPEEAQHLSQKGYHIRHTHQFYWHNNSYQDFDDFLTRFKQKRKKEIRRERQSLTQAGVKIQIHSGSELNPALAAEAYQLYLKTIDKKWSHAYLTESFFQRVFLKMADRIVYFRATSNQGRPLGGSLSFQKGNKLFGRYWGSFVDVKNLHFELCYYQLIERAITQGLTLVEAGAQGPQKLNRGFLPTITLSAHHFRHPGLDQAVKTYINEEKAALEEALTGIRPHFPFKEI